MFEEPTKEDNLPKEQPYEWVDFDADNLVSAFDLLLRIDLRINPQLYKPNDNS